ncbi:hypothetical protein [Peribacillus asahii]|uniref:hypothetical protein n=1 Tax=Peribacillus asahii TaxID=228899 RepID=UPI0038019004
MSYLQVVGGEYLTLTIKTEEFLLNKGFEGRMSNILTIKQLKSANRVVVNICM